MRLKKWLDLSSPDYVSSSFEKDEFSSAKVGALSNEVSSTMAFSSLEAQKEVVTFKGFVCFYEVLTMKDWCKEEILGFSEINLVEYFNGNLDSVLEEDFCLRVVSFLGTIFFCILMRV